MLRVDPDRALCALLAAWLAVAAAMAFVATSNFRVVEPADLRDSEEVFAAHEDPVERRMAIRYIASELNRFYFQRYDRIQALLAGACFLALVASRRRSRTRALLFGLVVAIVAANAFHYTPRLVEIGREIDFLPRDGEPAEPVREFWRLHHQSVGLELGKMALLASLLFSCLRRAPASETP